MYNGELLMMTDFLKYRDQQKKLGRGLFKYVPIPAFILLCIFVTAVAVHIAARYSTPFADFFNENVSAVVRAGLAYATGWIPFSLAETIIVGLPLYMIVVFITVVVISGDAVKTKRVLVSLFSVVTLFYSTFVFGYGIGYMNSPLDQKLGIEREKVSAEQLYDTALAVNFGLEEVIDDIDYSITTGASVMPYDLDEMTSRLMDAYRKAYESYPFISRFDSRIKYIALSKPMTYTHISGVYSYYTGEANLNINFPDYTLPYTAAHELAHQRGIAPEDEANFVAFLVCKDSDDAYIRYSGYQNMLEYLMNALYSADRELYYQLLGELDNPVRSEISAYNEFFEPYRDSKASEVSSAMNDTYLKAAGDEKGEKSYGMVVDLAVAYYADSE